MREFFKAIDTLLRGGFAREEDLRAGRIAVRMYTLLWIGLFLGVAYGVFMGLYGVMRPGYPTALQLLASAMKVPLLFLLTLGVTYPSLYVFSALAGSRLQFQETLRLLLIGICINMALLASFGPVTGFFTLSTDSYPFMIVLNVLFFTVGGIAGLIFMYKSVRVVVVTPVPPLSAEKEGNQEGGPETEPAKEEKPETTPRPMPPDLRLRQFQADTRSKFIFYTWAIIYGAVGAQMGWILKPFVGSPDLPFEFFRTHRQSNFFEAFFSAIGSLFG